MIITLKELVKHKSKYLRVIKEAAFPNKAIITDSINIHVDMSIFLGSLSEIVCFLPLFELNLPFFKMRAFLQILDFMINCVVLEVLLFS